MRIGWAPKNTTIMTDFIELARNRRSIRKYTDQAVEPEKIEKLLQAALMAPAGKRLNPWEFVVVEDRAILRQMAGCRTYGSQMLEGSPLGIVICADASVSDTWKFDCAIAAENILLEAADLGLGACWVQVLDRMVKDDSDETAEQMVRSLLGIPEHLNVICIISVGYKNEERQPHELEKLQYDKVHYGKY